jgi:hypothetical protein
MTSRERLDLAINALANLYENGQLLASTAPAELLQMAVDEIQASREERKKTQP